MVRPDGPPIGRRRIYRNGDPIDLFPGEQISGRVDVAALDRVIAEGGNIEPLIDVIVEPAPGLLAWLLRLRWRLVGRRFHRGVPEITHELTSLVVKQRQEDRDADTGRD